MMERDVLDLREILARADVETASEHRFFVGLMCAAVFSAVFWGGVALWVFA